jgi:hypothetical protein
MIDEPIPYQPTDKVRLLGAQHRIEELEAMMRHFDRSSMHLHHYVKAIDGLPNAEEWQIIREQVWDMVNPYGDRSPSR